MKIIFDLDGTLICSKKRLYELFCDLINSRELSFSDYWEFKFSGCSNQDILKNVFDYPEEKINKFFTLWMDKIEDSYYLEMDTVIEGLQEFLEKVSINNQLYICTARQSVVQVKAQLKNLAILEFFEDIFVTEQCSTKTELLLNSGMVFSENDWFVGDTGHDIKTGQQLGIKTCAVLSGFMSESALKGYEPDSIINNVTLLDV